MHRFPAVAEPRSLALTFSFSLPPQTPLTAGFRSNTYQNGYSKPSKSTTASLTVILALAGFIYTSESVVGLIFPILVTDDLKMPISIIGYSHAGSKAVAWLVMMCFPAIVSRFSFKSLFLTVPLCLAIADVMLVLSLLNRSVPLLVLQRTCRGLASFLDPLILIYVASTSSTHAEQLRFVAIYHFVIMAGGFFGAPIAGLLSEFFRNLSIAYTVCAAGTVSYVCMLRLIAGVGFQTTNAKCEKAKQQLATTVPGGKRRFLVVQSLVSIFRGLSSSWYSQLNAVILARVYGISFRVVAFLMMAGSTISLIAPTAYLQLATFMGFRFLSASLLISHLPALLIFNFMDLRRPPTLLMCLLGVVTMPGISQVDASVMNVLMMRKLDRHQSSICCTIDWVSNVVSQLIGGLISPLMCMHTSDVNNQYLLVFGIGVFFHLCVAAVMNIMNGNYLFNHT